MRFRKLLVLMLVLMAAGLVLSACGGADEPTPASEPDTSAPADDAGEEAALEGDVDIDGSSTVYPVTTAVAEEFANLAPDVRVSVGLSGTGGGFKKFCPGEIDLSNASRAITEDEIADCAANGVEWSEYTVALDGLTVMVNPQNDWLQCLSQEDLVAVLGANSEITNWSDLDPAYPAEPIQFYIPDPDSGTRDYMLEVVEGVDETVTDLRQDENTSVSSDDNVLLEGVANEQYALAFFGYAYYQTQQDRVRAVPIENPETGECVLPSDETVQNGDYAPLSRPLFIYLNNEVGRSEPQVAEFVRYYFSDEGAPLIMSSVGYSMPPDGTYEDNLARLDAVLAGENPGGE